MPTLDSPNPDLTDDDPSANDAGVVAAKASARLTKRRDSRRRGCGLCCGGCALLPLLIVAIALLFFPKVPQTYPPATHPLPPPTRTPRGAFPDSFSSPYIGHTGSWDGKGGGMGGSSRDPNLDSEQAMGLRWTFVPAHWSALEPDGPVDLSQNTPAAWAALDHTIIAAHQRGLNVLIQIVVGGNAGGPPRWVERKEPGRSAPATMAELGDFVEKLAHRYSPGGAVPVRERWRGIDGVYAWELDNEPASYLTHWENQAAEYAWFVADATTRLRRANPRAIVVAPAIASGDARKAWFDQALSARPGGKLALLGVDAISFHLYEGMDTFFDGHDRTIERVFDETRAAVARHATKDTPGPRRYWFTEGSFDFFGVLAADRRASWRFQFMTRAFAAGVEKVIVMDPSLPEQAAIRAYIYALPDPFPMTAVSAGNRDGVRVTRGAAAVFRHDDRSGGKSGRVWVVWASAGKGDAAVELPVKGPEVTVIGSDGRSRTMPAAGGVVRLDLPGDPSMAPGFLVLDRERAPVR